jgi:hypothetical protein
MHHLLVALLLLPVLKSRILRFRKSNMGLRSQDVARQAHVYHDHILPSQVDKTKAFSKKLASRPASVALRGIARGQSRG